LTIRSFQTIPVLYKIELKLEKPAKGNRIDIARKITIILLCGIDKLLKERDKNRNKTHSLDLEIRTQRDREGSDNEIKCRQIK